MIIDSQNLFSDAQALTASAASTNLIDLGAENEQGIGEPMAVVMTVDVAADFTTGDETYVFNVEVDALAAFGSAVTAISKTILAAALTAGSQHIIPIPPDESMERFVRIGYVLAGTTPTLTITAMLMPMSMVQNDKYHLDGITIS